MRCLKMVKVSIYIPTHNRRLLLERALRSVIQQTHSDLDIIVVNDASTDDTRAYLDGLRASEPRLTVIHVDKARGAPAARNRAIKIAAGQFITGLDDDDEFTPTRIENLLNYWSNLGDDANRISGLFTQSVMTDGKSSSPTTDRKDEVSYEDLFHHNFIGNQIFCPTGHLAEIGGFDENMPALQDLELFMRLVRRYGPARLVPDCSYVCYVDEGRDRISKNSKKRYDAFERIMQKNDKAPAHLKPYLFMQLFSPFYGTVPSFGDWSRMIQWGATPALLAKMLRATIRNALVTARGYARKSVA